MSISHKYVQKWNLNSAIKFSVKNPEKYVQKSSTLLLTEIRPFIVCYDIDMLILCSKWCALYVWWKETTAKW
jgi:hypothetical protein